MTVFDLLADVFFGFGLVFNLLILLVCATASEALVAVVFFGLLTFACALCFEFY